MSAKLQQKIQPYRKSEFISATQTKMLLQLALLLLPLIGCKNEKQMVVNETWKQYYDNYQLSGSFILFDPLNQTKFIYNPAQQDSMFTPASTFKICNTLIGLETAVITDEHFTIPWDSITRNPVWDSDHNLIDAFANSTVWYYQEVARRIGAERMKHWLDTLQYGNRDTSGGIDKFWLEGGLLISPTQQINFLSRFYHQELPVSPRSMSITKKIMLDSAYLDTKIYGKTGWGGQDGKEIGWFVGFIEKGNKVYFFSNCVQSTSALMEDLNHAIQFDKSRKEITYKIIFELAKAGELSN